MCLHTFGTTASLLYPATPRPRFVMHAASRNAELLALLLLLLLLLIAVPAPGAVALRAHCVACTHPCDAVRARTGLSVRHAFASVRRVRLAQGVGSQSAQSAHLEAAYFDVQFDAEVFVNAKQPLGSFTPPPLPDRASLFSLGTSVLRRHERPVLNQALFGTPSSHGSAGWRWGSCGVGGRLGQASVRGDCARLLPLTCAGPVDLLLCTLLAQP